MAPIMSAEAARYCYIDLDIDQARSKLAAAAAFCHATNTRYGFSSSDLRHLGGSELKRLPELMETDHEWGEKAVSQGMLTKSPSAGNRIILKLYWEQAPLACENFATLCQNAHKPKIPVGESGKALTYKDSTVHRVESGFCLQAGDFVFGNGSGGESVFGKKTFKDEKGGLEGLHDRRGVLSMGNSGKHSNSSQFFLTFQPTPQCDRKHVVFGEVVSGMAVIDLAEKAAGSASGKPTVPVTITDCGVWLPFKTPGSGFWYDSPDPESYSGISPIFMVRPRAVVVTPSRVVMDKFRNGMGGRVTIEDSFVMEDPEESIVKKIVESLEAFAIDVVILAPACRAVQASLGLPPSWTKENGISIDQVILPARPVDCLARVLGDSWMAQRPGFSLDGNK